MKKVVAIGNRLNALKALLEFKELELVKLYILRDSMLERQLSELDLPPGLETNVFGMDEKARLLEEVSVLDFDILLSNGCPFILPVTKMRRPGQLFFNVHPTLLPDLKGKTPLNGVFMTHRQAIGATMHYIDDGIDTGGTVCQAQAPVTPDLDQGLVYKISFDLETVAFRDGMRKVIDSGYTFAGEAQQSEGSYFNRTPEMQIVDIVADDTDTIIDKIRSFGIKSLGTQWVIDGVSYTVFSGEKIVNPYLLQAYDAIPVGTLAFSYDGKMVVRTRDGMVKLTDFVQGGQHA